MDLKNFAVLRVEFEDASIDLGDLAGLLDHLAEALVSDPDGITIEDGDWRSILRLRESVEAWRAARDRADAAWLGLSKADRIKAGPPPSSA